ncbi:MAG: hypothetical protein ABI743_11175 [bacterium]
MRSLLGLLLLLLVAVPVMPALATPAPDAPSQTGSARVTLLESHMEIEQRDGYSDISHVDAMGSTGVSFHIVAGRDGVPMLRLYTDYEHTDKNPYLRNDGQPVTSDYGWADVRTIRLSHCGEFQELGIEDNWGEWHHAGHPSSPFNSPAMDYGETINIRVDDQLNFATLQLLDDCDSGGHLELIGYNYTEKSDLEPNDFIPLAETAEYFQYLQAGTPLPTEETIAAAKDAAENGEKQRKQAEKAAREEEKRKKKEAKKKNKKSEKAD